MMLEDIERLIFDNPDLSDIGEGQSEEDVAAAAKKLGVTFPESFRLYLLKWGRLSFGPNEYQGLGSSVYNVVLTTERIRRVRGLPSELVVVVDHEGDEYVCLETRAMKEGECPVVIWDSPTQTISRPRSENFAKFLEADIRDFLS
jgi:hypothetical protein